jgi:hypothetical protein
MKYPLLAVLGLLLTLGCNPLRHYQAVAVDTDVTMKEKNVIRPWVVAHFPTEIKYLPGTLKIDTVPNQKVIDTLNVLVDSLLGSLFLSEEAALTFEEWYLISLRNIDSLKKEIKKRCVLEIREKYDTAYLENGPTIDGLRTSVVELTYDRDKLTLENEGLVKENTGLHHELNKSDLIWWLLIIGLSLVILFLVFLLFKR